MHLFAQFIFWKFTHSFHLRNYETFHSQTQKKNSSMKKLMKQFSSSSFPDQNHQVMKVFLGTFVMEVLRQICFYTKDLRIRLRIENDKLTCVEWSLILLITGHYEYLLYAKDVCWHYQAAPCIKAVSSFLKLLLLLIFHGWSFIENSDGMLARILLIINFFIKLVRNRAIFERLFGWVCGRACLMAQCIQEGWAL